MKHVVLAFCIALPLTTLAAQGEEARHAGSAGDQTHHAQTSPVDAHAAVRNSKERGSRMGGCRAQATDKGLTGAEYKAALVECMKQAQ